MLHLRSARRLRSCEYSREILGKEGGREGIPRWRSLGYFLGGDLGPRVLPGFSASNKARSLRFPSKNWVRKDDFFLTFCEEGWGFPLLFFPPSSPQIPYFQPLSSHHPQSHFSSLSPSPGPGAAGVAVTSPSCDLARALPIPCAAGKKEEKELWKHNLRGCRAWKSPPGFHSCRRGAVGAEGDFGDERSWWELDGEGRPFALAGGSLL